MKICYYASTCGNVRKNNEDCFHINGFIGSKCKLKKGFRILKNNSFISVCDGMGGEEFGEVASYIAVSNLSKLKSLDKDTIINKIKDINDLVCNEIEKRDARLGSTIVSAVIKKDKIDIYNVGDSRAYIFNKKLIQLSKDHTVAALNGKSKGALTQHLGVFKDEIEIEPFMIDGIEINKNNYILLCSDGLYDMIKEEDIENILSSKMNDFKKRDELLERALVNGGKDNITFLLVRCM